MTKIGIDVIKVEILIYNFLLIKIKYNVMADNYLTNIAPYGSERKRLLGDYEL